MPEQGSEFSLLTLDELRANRAEFGRILREIRDSKSYRQTHLRFTEFLKERFGISFSYAYTLMTGRRSSNKRIPVALRWEIWERDNFTCRYCGKRRFLAVDHIIPQSGGGTNDPENLITTCRTCNSRKGRKTYEAFLESLREEKKVEASAPGVA